MFIFSTMPEINCQCIYDKKLFSDKQIWLCINEQLKCSPACDSSHFSLYISIDAVDPDSGIARYGNDEHRHPNCIRKLVDNAPLMFLKAAKKITQGSELRYDYVMPDAPWRKVCVCVLFEFVIIKIILQCSKAVMQISWGLVLVIYLYTMLIDYLTVIATLSHSMLYF